jgi:ribosomal protein S18 acetylase RimI-like enzyme
VSCADFAVFTAQRSCLGDVRKIERYAFYPYLYKSDRYFKRKICQGTLWLCSADNEPAGYICFQLHKRYAVIQDLATAVNHRRKGVAERLMKSVISYLKNNFPGIVIVRLMVSVQNEEARALYEKLLFRPAGGKKRYYGNHDGVMMIRSLV